MAIDLSKPIDRSVTAFADFLSDLQGNILKGHGRDHVILIFLSLKAGEGNLKLAKEWISGFAGRLVTSAQRQFQETDDFRTLRIIGGLFANLFLSRSGYDILGVPPPEDSQFRQGMKGSQSALNDPNPDKWDVGYQGNIHVLVLLAHDDISELTRAARSVLAEARQFAEVVAGERGTAIRNADCEAVEHFGYVDGRSQPLFLTEDIKKETAAEFDPSASPSLVLVPDPNGSAEVSFGSYLVFRKLEQNVQGFKQAEQNLADALGLTGDGRELAGAMAVGRFEDGTPVVAQNTDGLNHPVPNDFDYSSDVAGLRCPLQAHIRKMNPRGGTESLGATLISERNHRIARRGITYGERCHQPKEEPAIEDLPTGGVGLLFMCFQSDIANQFEFMQRQWANNENFQGPGTGLDGVIGQAQDLPSATPQKWPQPWGESTTAPFSFQGFVTLKGGEYFFAPSLSFLKSLGAGNRSSAGRAIATKVMNVVVGSHTEAEAITYPRYAGLIEVDWIRPEALAAGFPLTRSEDLVFHGGRTIRALNYANFFVGGTAAWSASDRNRIDDGLSRVMADRRLNNVLSQYFNGDTVQSDFRGSSTLQGSPPRGVTRADLEGLVVQLRGTGALGDADLRRTVFNFMLPRGTVLTTDEIPFGALAAVGKKPGGKKRPTSSPSAEGIGIGHTLRFASSLRGLGGYHGSVILPGTGERIYYAVGVFSEGQNGIAAFADSWKNVVAVLYHELCEVRTDPDVEEANRSGNSGFLGWTSPAGEEIGDFPIRESGALGVPVFVEVPMADGSGALPIQLMYSNAAHGPEGPINAPHT